ncbi:MAG: TetR/AcrR family transcriptional regulator [Solobacterium sp.]|nr:TetR/AcrR family transcriptional regulator [Solobacterium sp.]
MEAKEAIRRQFMKEYAKKDFSAITVKGLCADTPVARSTFYAYFENTDEVLRSIEDELIERLKNVCSHVPDHEFPDLDFSEFMDEVESVIKNSWSYIYAFLVIQPNQRFVKRWKEAIKVNFRRRYPDKTDSKTFEPVAEILASSMISVYTYWMEHPDDISTNDIKPLIHKVLNSLVSSL